MEKLKLERLLGDYECKLYHFLPKFMKRRANALKKIQIEQVNIQHQYHKELQELELKYAKLYDPLYERRQKIISGEHEPTDEECQVPPKVDADFYKPKEEDAEEQEFLNEHRVEFSDEEETALKSSVKGLPSFWLGVLMSSYNFSDSIEQDDKAILKHLNDIKLSYNREGERLTYTLDFVFDDNPYFTNKVLTKTYTLKNEPDEAEPFEYEGWEVCNSVGCKIDWNPGKDVTKRSVTVKQVNKNDGRTREKKKEFECDSFFHFFSPPTVEDADNDPMKNIDDALGAILAIDFELGEVIRLNLIPNATLFYTGFMEDHNEDYDLDDDDDMDEEDVDEEDSDDDSDDFSSSDDDESEDSLNHKCNNKNGKSCPKKSPKRSPKSPKS